MPPSRGKGRVDEGSRQAIQEILRQHLRRPGTKVISAQRVGRDSRNLPVYVVRFTQPLSHRPYGTPQTTFTRSYTLQSGKLGKPVFGEKGTPDPDEGADALQHRKDLWLESVAKHPLLTDAQKKDLTSQIHSYSGGLQQLNNFVKRYIESATNAPAPPAPDEDPTFGIDYGPGGGGGGGGGFAGPTYRAPDRRVVEDYVKGTMVSLIGTVDPALIDPLVNTYMQDHRRNFDDPAVEIDPAMSVVEALRNTEDYQEIHALRPESADERNWISDRRTAAAEGGLQTELQEDFAIEQATVGGDVPDVQEGAALEQTQASGTVRGTPLETKLRAVASAVMGGVR